MGRNGNDLKLEGLRFGSLVVLRKHTERDEWNRILWVCICDCNPIKEILIVGHYLTGDKKDNCGCQTVYKQRDCKRKYNIYDLTGEYGIGYTSNTNKEFWFDLEDYNKIKDYCWIEHDKYICARNINGNKGIVRIHRLIMEVTDIDIKVDHINHKEYDNRKSELRVCSNQENCMNHKLHSNNTSGKSGITYRKDTNKWRSRLWFKGKCYNLGSFASYDEAVKVRNDKEIELFKEFRCENESEVD